MAAIRGSIELQVKRLAVRIRPDNLGNGLLRIMTLGLLNN